MNNYYVIYQAKAFYNAYIYLERIYNEAEGLLFYVPMVINGAFSIEITLKAILINQGILFKKEHNLFVLFDLLPSDIKNMIWNWVAKKTPEYADKEKRMTELMLISDAFKQWRYVYEESVPAFDTRFLSSFANATIGVMFSLGYNVDLVKTTTLETYDEIEAKIQNNRKKMIDKNLKYIERSRRKN